MSSSHLALCCIISKSCVDRKPANRVVTLTELTDPMSTEPAPFSLTRAPSIEAVMDIGVEPMPGFDLAACEERAEEFFSASYPKKQKQFIQSAEFTVNAAGGSHLVTGNGLAGFLFRSADEKQIVQVKAGGFAFNRLAPYDSMDAWLPEAKLRWGEYLQIVRPVRIRRVALRYINRLMLPLRVDGSLELSEYLTTGPKLADEARFRLGGFLHQHQIVDSVTGFSATILQTLQPIEEHLLPVIFDIEVQRVEARLEPDAGELWTTIQDLRILKNRIFTLSLTPQCLSLFQLP